ncbi:putative ABC exporter domain-containing protein [Cognatilysobacter terrigena]|uniref:putative ABC exporter domain-containing protein n=1 Tax=Cognatilysobacter terrigena TaxID=2488749 RepID=UPI00105C0A79|nr:putative ABC exporter domain-containing protein [Lysobacter terrigena]
MNGVVRALAYMQTVSLANRVRQRVRRLKQPKYLIGAIAGVAYFYGVVFRHMIGPNSNHVRFMAMPDGMGTVIASLAALGTLLFMLSAWIFPSDRAVLRFNEAEAAFLFPAPISRTGLIHFSVIRSQLMLFVSVFLLSLLLQRGRAMGINPFQYATALWVIVATTRLHFLGASFTRERLLDLGVRPIWRRIAGVALLVALVAVCVVWARDHAPLPGNLEGPRQVTAYVASVLDAGPAHSVLMPFRALTAPMVATSTAAFMRAMPWALLLFALHYAWVVRSQVSFEEASMALATRRAESAAAKRDGRNALRAPPKRARKAPFKLAPRGFAPVAFLWKGLIAAGPLWRARSLLIAVVVVLIATQALSANPVGAAFLKVIGIVSLAIAGWSAMVGPMFVQGSLRTTLDQLDVLRATPLRGWQIALGQLLAPIAMLVPVQWLMLLTAERAFSNVAWLTPGLVAAFAIAAIVLAPAVCAVMLCVPFAGLLVFPGWNPGGRGGGVEVMGQRMIFGGVYLITLAISLVPATIVGGALLWGVKLVAGWPPAIAVAAIAGAAVLGGEAMLMVRWLGGRIERFDVSTELR